MKKWKVYVGTVKPKGKTSTNKTKGKTYIGKVAPKKVTPPKKKYKKMITKAKKIVKKFKA